MGYDVMGYTTVDFGPLGKYIIAERDPEAMVLLKRTLEHTDGPRTVVVDGFLPLRNCDYALLIAEELLRRDQSHSFGPHDAYEGRDDSRRNALRELFGADAVLPKRVEYIYLDANGKDISKEKRLTGRPGMP